MKISRRSWHYRYLNWVNQGFYGKGVEEQNINSSQEEWWFDVITCLVFAWFFIPWAAIGRIYYRWQFNKLDASKPDAKIEFTD